MQSEQIISACVVPTVKHGGGGVMVCFAGDTVCDLFRIQGTLAWLAQHSAAIRHPIWFGLNGTIIIFSTGQ